VKFACPLCRECTPAIKARHLKADVCLWRAMGAVLDDDRESLAAARQFDRRPAESDPGELDSFLDYWWLCS
jgi:hypothetical protein